MLNLPDKYIYQGDFRDIRNGVMIESHSVGYMDYSSNTYYRNKYMKDGFWPPRKLCRIELWRVK